jgi:hypothetical protein
MSDDLSPVLALPLIQAAQAQKHVTHNEALRLLDVLVQPAVASRSTATPPPAPAPGARFIVPAGALAAWAGQDGTIALAEGGGWAHLAPLPGWQAWVEDEAAPAVFDGAIWTTPAERAARVARLGVGTDADATNRLAVAAPASLFTHDGAGHQLKVNKAAPGDTASLLFQTGWSGRAEIGTAGNDDLAVKVSADGSLWHTALSVAGATGAVSLPQGLSVAGLVTGTAVTQSDSDPTAGRLTRVGDFGLGSSGNAPLLASLDAIATPSGLWRTTGAGTAGTFPAGSHASGHLLVHRHNANTLWQLYTPFGSAGSAANILFSRVYNPGTETWTAWQRLYAQNSILGTVSQSAGVPTGALLERVTNANGDYTRWADGTQICTRVIALASGLAVWTFPAAFSIAPRCMATASHSGPRYATMAAPTTTTVEVRAYDQTGAAANPGTHVFAIGRWF